MIQFKKDEVCQILKALVHYRDEETGHDDIWDRYDRLVDKMTKYGEEVDEEKFSCES